MSDCDFFILVQTKVSYSIMHFPFEGSMDFHRYICAFYHMMLH